MRIMGLDFGSKTVGVAVCDPLGITAQTVETITRASENKMRQTLARIEQLIGEYEIERIVLGYPKNMNNTVGERGEKTQEFKAALERRTGLEVILWDHGDGFRRIRGFLCVGRNKDKCKELSACDRRAGRRGRRVLYP